MRPLSGGRFAVTVGWRLAAFVALSLAGPWLAATIQSATACTETEGACAAISVATGTLLRPLILILLALLLLRPCWRRMRTLGMWGIAGWLVPALLLLDWRTLTVFGPTYVPVSFGLGLLNSGFPFFTVLALLIILLMILARPAGGQGDSLWRRHGIVGQLGWLAALVAVIAGGVSTTLYLMLLQEMSLTRMASPLFAQAAQAGRIASIACLVAMLGVLFMIVGEPVRRPAPITPAEPA
ncbi:MAG TPA: hypothetical protein VFK86_08690 [Bauldia sp.]|nr:hypothetical protein [Bauldia sp.]